MAVDSAVTPSYREKVTVMLTDTAVKNAQPADKAYKLADSLGLYLLVRPNGNKWWRVDYRFGGKRQTLSCGVYPKISLKAARMARDKIRQYVDAGMDPSMQRKADAMVKSGADAFEAVAREWHALKRPTWSAEYGDRLMTLLERDILPFLGNRPIAEIDAPSLLLVLRKMESRGVTNTAHKAREVAGAVFRYGIATGRCSGDPAAALRGALAAQPVQHHSAIIEPRQFGRLLRDIDAYQGGFTVRCALKLSPLLALRPGELRHLEWREIDFDHEEIRIPGSKMKMGSDHIVPLSSQALTIFRELHALTGHGRYCLPSIRAPRGDRPMSENTINAALRYLGYDGKTMTAHGFRGSFCSLANEKLHFNPDAIERQLAHAERNKIRAAYLHSEFLPERRKLMQAWADYLDSLRAGDSNIVPLRAVKR